MTDNSQSSSSRGWIVLTIVGGTALAVPFMHRSEGAASESSRALAVAPRGVGDSDAGNLGEFADTRRIVGSRPNTDAIARALAASIQPKPSDVPAWAVRSDKIDTWIDSAVVSSLPAPSQSGREKRPVNADVRTWLDSTPSRTPDNEETVDQIANETEKPRFGLWAQASESVNRPSAAKPSRGAQIQSPVFQVGNSAARAGGPQSATEELPPPSAPVHHLTQPETNRRKHFVYQPGHKPQG